MGRGGGKTGEVKKQGKHAAVEKERAVCLDSTWSLLPSHLHRVLSRFHPHMHQMHGCSLSCTKPQPVVNTPNVLQRMEMHLWGWRQNSVWLTALRRISASACGSSSGLSQIASNPEGFPLQSPSPIRSNIVPTLWLLKQRGLLVT